MEKPDKKLISHKLAQVIFDTLSSADVYTAKNFQKVIKSVSKEIAKEFIKKIDAVNEKTKVKKKKSKKENAGIKKEIV